jgi:plastocyanin
MAGRITAAALVLFAGAITVRAADIQGSVVIERKLTKRQVTAGASLYQRGSTVELGANTAEDPLAYERSHVAVYLDGPLPAAVDRRVTNPVVTRVVTPVVTPVVAMEQKDRRFVPDLLVVPAGATVSFPNFDPIFHNVFSLSKPKSFDLGNYPQGQTRTVAFSKPGIVYVNCHLHPNMAATIVITPSRWAATPDAEGQFRLPDVPAGRYTVVAWHKSAGFFRQTADVKEPAGARIQFVIPFVEPSAAKQQTPEPIHAHR